MIGEPHEHRYALVTFTEAIRVTTSPGRSELFEAAYARVGSSRAGTDYPVLLWLEVHALIDVAKETRRQRAQLHVHPARVASIAYIEETAAADWYWKPPTEW